MSQKTPPPPPRKVQPAEIVPARTFKFKLEPWMVPVVVRALEKGMPLSSVAGLIGVRKNTLIRWRQQGLEEDCKHPELVEFAVAVEEARARAIECGVELLTLHAQTDWRATVELLKAQDPETFNPAERKKVEVEFSQKKDLSALSDAELLQLEMLEAKMASKKALPA